MVMLLVIMIIHWPKHSELHFHQVVNLLFEIEFLFHQVEIRIVIVEIVMKIIRS